MNSWKSIKIIACLPAQDCVLQRLLSLPEPGQFPPFRSVLILLRDLAFVPPPQPFEQDDHFDHGPQTQFSAETTADGSSPEDHEMKDNKEFLCIEPA